MRAMPLRRAIPARERACSERRPCRRVAVLEGDPGHHAERQRDVLDAAEAVEVDLEVAARSVEFQRLPAARVVYPPLAVPEDGGDGGIGRRIRLGLAPAGSTPPTASVTQMRRAAFVFARLITRGPDLDGKHCPLSLWLWFTRRPSAHVLRGSKMWATLSRSAKCAGSWATGSDVAERAALRPRLRLTIGATRDRRPNVEPPAVRFMATGLGKANIC